MAAHVHSVVWIRREDAGEYLEQLSGSLSRQSVTSMSEPGHRIVAGNRLNGETNRFLERFLGARAQSAQDGFDLGEGLLDRREVGRVRAARRAAGSDGLQVPGECGRLCGRSGGP